MKDGIKEACFLTGLSQDPSDRFFGWPTPLLYAIAPTVDAIRSSALELSVKSRVFEPLWYVEGENSNAIKKEFLSEIEGGDIVCASAIYDSLYPTLQLFEAAKKKNPEIITILGGAHFDEIHDIPRFSHEIGIPRLVDFAIAGDGEYALKALLEAISNGSFSEFKPSEIQGQAWICGGDGVYKTRFDMLNLDKLPFMPIEMANDEWHKNDYDIFADEKGNILPTVQIIAARGCPYKCNFCSEALAQANPRSEEKIVEELMLRKEQGYKAAFFDDSTFGTYPRLLNLLGKLEKIGLAFGCLNRFNLLTNPKIVEAYVRAGFRYVYCSIEQFDETALKAMNKGQKIRHIEESLKLLEQNGIAVGTSLLYGLANEKKESVEASLDFVQKWVGRGVIKLVSESILSFHPGTPEGKEVRGGFNRTPPNLGWPFNAFEEGQWYHHKHVTKDYLAGILEKSEQRFKHAMVRHRHSWHAEHGDLAQVKKTKAIR